MIEVAASDVHGLGAFAAQDLFDGDRIGVYEGRRYSGRQVSSVGWSSGPTYVFGLSDGSILDATQGGNATRHLNHSCAPNCIAYEEAGPRGRLFISFYALRDIRAGEELLIDYSLDVDESEDRSLFACACGADACRGTMLGTADMRGM